MTDFADFCTQIAEFENRQDWSSTLVTSFVRMAEQRLNERLRVDRMIRTAANTITGRCTVLPDDWLESILVELENDNAADGYLPIRYKSMQDEFFSLSDPHAEGYYTIKGRSIFVGGAPDATEGQGLRITYYAEVPVFADAQDSWVYTKYPALYLAAARIFAKTHAVGEEDQAVGMAQALDEMIQKLNNLHLLAKASGSRLTRTRTRSFG